MFKLWSIRSLLQLWSLATILAIIVIASVASYTNKLFSETQGDLTEKVLPMEDASRKISAVAFSFITRQKQVIASQTIEEINTLIPRETLEAEFNRYLKRIAASVTENERGNAISVSLQEKFQHFLEVDSNLLGLIRRQHELRTQLKKQIKTVDSLEQKIQNRVEAISGRINLQVSRYKREIRQRNPNQQSSNLISERAFRKQDNIQKLSQSVRLNVLRVSYLTQALIQSENTDRLLSLRDNDIKQHNAVLKADVKQLKSLLGDNNELAKMTSWLEQDIGALAQIVVDGKSAIYSLRLQQLQNEELLSIGQQSSITTLKIVTAKLNELSSLLGDKSLKTVNNSTVVADQARWIIIILSLSITIGMLRFISLISQRINGPLDELRSAMHSLSSQEFDTRLKPISGNSEFSILAEDFNLFAENTQHLIHDLDTARESLQTREQHLSAILNSVPEAILTLSADGVIESTNPTAGSVLKANEEVLIGLNLARFFGDGQQMSSVRDLEARLEKSREFQGRDYNGKTFSMWVSLNLVSSAHGDVWVCVISDITEWKRVEAELKVASSELDAILENAMVGIALIKDRVLVRVNNKFEQLFGYDRDVIEGQSTRSLYASEEVYNQSGDDVYSEMQEGGSYVGEVQLARQDGSLFWGIMSGKAIDLNNPIAGSIWLFEDITLQKEKDETLLKLASFDSLTGLPNRNVFNDRIEHAIHKANRSSSRLAIFFLDLDHFKHINDSLGHKAGDTLLREVADRLKTCVREGDTVARLGGDEFTLILEEVRSAQHVAKVADKVLAALSQSYMLDTTEVNISPSIGISLYPADGRDADTLLRNADAAMYHAKNNGRNNFQFYSAEMNAQATKRLAMESSLRRALEQNEFELHFQPQIDLATGRISGAEALLRWNNETWGNVSPAEFVPILEDTGLISTVGEVVIKKAIDGYLSLRDKLDPEFQIAVNLSGRQFQGGQLATFVRTQLEQSGMSAKNLELEITETVLMDDTELAVTTLNDISALGITLAIDDFGTGYSSLSYLKRFPLNVLKIDRSFVRDVTHDDDDAAIVDAILAMSRHLNLKVVAEGVENKEQLAFLQEKNCDRVQGYFFSKPLSLADFSDFIDQHNANLN